MSATMMTTCDRVADRKADAYRSGWAVIAVMVGLGGAGCVDDGGAVGAGIEPPDSHGSTTVHLSSSTQTAVGSTGSSENPTNDSGATGAPTSTGEAADAGQSSTSRGEGGSSTGEPVVCAAPRVVVSCDGLDQPPDPWTALGLGCPGGPEQTIPVVSAGFYSTDPQAWRVASRLGTHVDAGTSMATWGPTEGDQFLMVSTGRIAAPDAGRRVVMSTLDEDANDNPDDKPLPAPMDATPGSAGTPFEECDGQADCSDSLQDSWTSGGAAANDLVWFQFATEVPAGTHGFSIDMALFSEEFPEYVNTAFNDMFVVWESSEAYVGNLCVFDQQPCTVTSLWPVEYQEFAPQLEGTGFAGATGAEGGGATPWQGLRGPAFPRETLELTFALFDMGDDQHDTLVLLDRFSWDCDGCLTSAEHPCGLAARR